MADIDLGEFLYKAPKKCKAASMPFTEEQRAKFDAACATPESEIASVRICDVLTSWNMHITLNTVIAHRRGKCCCG